MEVSEPTKVLKAHVVRDGQGAEPPLTILERVQVPTTGRRVATVVAQILTIPYSQKS